MTRGRRTAEVQATQDARRTEALTVLGGIERLARIGQQRLEGT